MTVSQLSILVTDMSEVWFSHGELSAEKHAESSQMNIMGGAAGVSIVFCTFVALILYGTLLVFHFRNKNKRPLLVDAENPSFKDDTMVNFILKYKINL